MLTKRIFFVFSILSLMFIFLIACDQLPPTHIITVSFGEGGSISPEGVVAVSEGESQTFTITPDNCYQIDQVLVDGVSTGADSSYTFADVNQNHTIQVSFVAIQGAYIDGIGKLYSSIQGAIDIAKDFETIIVCPGTYQENIILDNKQIVVRSTDPSNPDVVAVTIIDGGGNDSVVRFMGGDESVLKGFTIRNGAASHLKGGGINVHNSSPTISENIITDNSAKQGGGISITGGSPTITENTIDDNYSTQYGGGIYINNSSPTINGNIIDDNYSNYKGGGIYAMNNSYPAITDNKFNDNMARESGGGICVSADSDLLPDDVRLTGWGSPGGTHYREHIPKDHSQPAEPINGPAGNTFSGNRHGEFLTYHSGAHATFE